MKIAVVGMGGVGGYYGAVLARQGQDVAFIARGKHLQAIQEQGLRVRDVLGDFRVQPARATNRPAEIGPVDFVLFCTKAYDAPSAAVEARALVGPMTTVLGLQNGLDAHERIGQVVGPEHMLAGITGIMSTLEAPGIINKVSDFAWIVLGELDGRLTPRVKRLRDAFDGTPVEVEVSERIMVDLWQKLLIVAPLAGFGSLTRLPVGDYRSVPETGKLITQLKREVMVLAAAAHAGLAADLVEKTMAGIDELPHLWKPSMQIDMESGHRSELEAIIGVICTTGRELGVGTPVADMIYAALLPVEQKARAS